MKATKRDGKHSHPKIAHIVLDVLTPLSDCRHETVEKIMERRISGVSYMCWMDFHNTFLCCGFLCARLISLYFVSFLCLSFRLPRRGLPRPILTTTGHHACVFIQVITPELSRSTIHVHRVITPAISNSYFIVLSVTGFYATTSNLLSLAHTARTHSTYCSRRSDRCWGVCMTVVMLTECIISWNTTLYVHQGIP